MWIDDSRNNSKTLSTNYYTEYYQKVSDQFNFGYRSFLPDIVLESGRGFFISVATESLILFLPHNSYHEPFFNCEIDVFCLFENIRFHFKKDDGTTFDITVISEFVDDLPTDGKYTLFIYYNEDLTVKLLRKLKVDISCRIHEYLTHDLVNVSSLVLKNTFIPWGHMFDYSSGITASVFTIRDSNSFLKNSPNLNEITIQDITQELPLLEKFRVITTLLILTIHNNLDFYRLHQFVNLREIRIQSSKKLTHNPMNSNISVLPEEIGKLSKLERLFIYDTDQLMTIPDIFYSMTQLKIVEFGLTSVSSFPTTLLHLPNLQKLSLVSLKLFPIPNLMNLPKLQIFEIFFQTLPLIPLTKDTRNLKETDYGKQVLPLSYLPEELPSALKIFRFYIYDLESNLKINNFYMSNWFDRPKGKVVPLYRHEEIISLQIKHLRTLIILSSEEFDFNINNNIFNYSTREFPDWLSQLKHLNTVIILDKETFIPDSILTLKNVEQIFIKDISGLNCSDKVKKYILELLQDWSILKDILKEIELDQILDRYY